MTATRWLRSAVGIVVMLLVAAFGVGYLTLIARPLKPPAAVDSLAELEGYLDDLTGHGPDSPPGLSLVVARAGRVVYQKGFGMADGPRSIPATADTIYHTFSMVKPLSAVAILQLQERGLLDIDDPVADYLPFFQVKYPSQGSGTVTIRHLLNHSSGLRNNMPELIGWIHFHGDPEWNQTRLIRQELPNYAELAYEPGSKGVYSNIGYIVVSALIEAVSGQSYQDYMLEHIFRPLRMDSTRWTYSEALADREAAGSSPRVDLQTLMLPLVLDKAKRDAVTREKRDGVIWFNRVYTDQRGPTGPVAPVTDMIRFVMAYLNEGELEGRRILSGESVALMTGESHVLPGNTPESRAYRDYERMYHGLGWYVVKGEEPFIAHGGGGPGFAAEMRLYPDRELGMVIIGNGTYLPKKKILDLVASLDW